jgi:hypothetical protein
MLAGMIADIPSGNQTFGQSASKDFRERWLPFFFYLGRCRVLLSSKSSDGVMRNARLIFASVYNVTF